MNDLKARWQISLIRLKHWEYWHSYLIYAPLLPYLAFLMLKARSLFFFNAANPGIAYGGFAMESKWKIYTDAVPCFFPPTAIVQPTDSYASIELDILSRFAFPFIAKPDIGCQGKGVAVINNRAEWEQYHAHCPTPYIVQHKINYPLEAGVFYVRLPNKTKGTITGIVQKEFVTVVGNGISSLYQLLCQNPRYLLQIEALTKIMGNAVMESILPKGEHKTVLEIGNHARGSMFTDASFRINDALVETIDAFCQQFEGFYFGRLDIRFDNWSDLARGKHFALIELNGAGSEPTHIYDPNYSLLRAWCEIARHWQLLQKIGAMNHAKGIPYLSFGEGIRLLRSHVKLIGQLDTFQLPLSQDGYLSPTHSLAT